MLVCDITHEISLMEWSWQRLSKPSYGHLHLPFWKRVIKKRKDSFILKSLFFLILVLSFRYETFVKSRGGDFSLDTPGHGKATLAWKISVLLYFCQKKILHPVWVRLKKLGHSPFLFHRWNFSFRSWSFYFSKYMVLSTLSTAGASLP